MAWTLRGTTLVSWWWWCSLKHVLCLSLAKLNIFLLRLILWGLRCPEWPTVVRRLSNIGADCCRAPGKWGNRLLSAGRNIEGSMKSFFWKFIFTAKLMTWSWLTLNVCFSSNGGDTSDLVSCPVWAEGNLSDSISGGISSKGSSGIDQDCEHNDNNRTITTNVTKLLLQSSVISFTTNLDDYMYVYQAQASHAGFHTLNWSQVQAVLVIIKYISVYKG